MSAFGQATDLEASEEGSSPFRAAFGRARVEAAAAVGAPLEQSADRIRESPGFEYRLVKRAGRRSAEQAAWNALGRQGWELVGVTGKQAAFKRRLDRSDLSP